MADITSDRKKHHIELASKSQVSGSLIDKRFYYEPMLGRHPEPKDFKTEMFGKIMRFPLWVSSMTGGTEMAANINRNLAKACNEFGLGMGLGSCRILLESPEHLDDFALRSVIGDQPLFANLGISQIEKSIAAGKITEIENMVKMLEADGLIIHVNPMQEWIQPEGDRLKFSPLETIKKFLDQSNLPLIVKEVGQGMGPESLKELMQLPVVIEFGAFGGTNFSQLELSRREEDGAGDWSSLAFVGHDAEDMLGFVNEIMADQKNITSKGFIVSGGIKNFLDGYYALEKLRTKAVYGQASELLKNARISYEHLQTYIEQQIAGYQLAQQYLTIRS